MDNIVKKLYRKMNKKMPFTTDEIFSTFPNKTRDKCYELYSSLNYSQREQFFHIIQNLTIFSEQHNENFFNAGFDCGVKYLSNMISDGTIPIDCFKK